MVAQRATLRFETGPDAGRSAMIFDAKQQKLYSLRHDEKLYLELSTANTSHAQPQTFDDIVITEPESVRRRPDMPAEVYHIEG